MQLYNNWTGNLSKMREIEDMSEEIRTKWCTKCKCHHPLSEFYHRAASRDGYYGQCSKTMYRYKKVGATGMWGKLKDVYDNPEKLAQWHKENPLKLIESFMNRSAVLTPSNERMNHASM